MRVRNQICLLLVTLLLLLPPAIGEGSQGTALSDTASQMAPGTWAQLTGTNVFNASLLKTGTTDWVLNYANSAVWDPVNKEVRFIGKGHGESVRMIIYDEATDNWSNGPTTVSAPHAYDNNAIDPSTGIQYYRASGWGGYRMRKYENGSWSDMPSSPTTNGAWSVATGLTFFPELNSLFLIGSNKLSQFDLDTQTWSITKTGLSTGGYHTVAEYDPVNKVIYYGGGNNETTLYRMDAQFNQTTIAEAPAIIGVNSSIVSVDPVSGDILLLGRDRSFWAYKSATDEWVSLDASSVPVFANQSSYPNRATVFTAVTPIADYGVTMYLNRFNGVWLYKSAAAAIPEPTTAALGIMALAGFGLFRRRSR